MALQIGSALEEAGYRLFSRTGAILLVAFFALMASFQVLFNSILATTYTRMGYGEIAAALPLTFDIPLTVAGAGIAVTSVAHCTPVVPSDSVPGARESFPEGAFARNVPLALVNVFVGGIVYSLRCSSGRSCPHPRHLRVVVSFLVLRYRDPDFDRPFKAPSPG